jgi:Cu2+-exporting ATPase
VLPACDEIDFTIGLGVSARIGRDEVRVGNERYFRMAGIGVARAAGYLHDAERHGHSALLVALNGSLEGAIAYADELRPEAAAVIAGLRQRNVHDIVMLTGDRAGVAARVARSLGIRHFHAEVMPADKADILQALRKADGPIAMVGDGVNDSVALAQADIGIALVEGADIAREAADVVLMDGNLGRILDAIDISRDAIGLVRQNYTLIAAFNTLALALALPSRGASPAVATLLSNGSALLAILNAMRPLLDAPARRTWASPGAR